jgi:glycine betaine/proline transport system substrate-binding protein
MNHKKFSMLGALSLGISALAVTTAMAGECGKVSIADMNWASANLMANVDAIILKEGYGCDVELVPGATETTFASMKEKGQPDVAGELWINAVRNPLEAAYAEGTLHKLVDGPIEGTGEGWWLSRDFADAHPEITTVEQMIEHPELVPFNEDPSKGAFMGCPSGWGCQLNNQNLFKAFDMEAKGWTLVDPGSAAGLDGAIAKASERGEPWFGYYWSPTSMIGKYNLKFLPFEVEYAGDDNWNNCITKPEGECLDPQKTAWVKSEVNTVVTDRFFKAGGPAIDYLSARVYPAEVMGQMLVYMDEEQATGEDAAWHFLETNDTWEAWVSPEVAAKVKAAF